MLNVNATSLHYGDSLSICLVEFYSTHCCFIAFLQLNYQSAILVLLGLSCFCLYGLTLLCRVNLPFFTPAQINHEGSFGFVGLRALLDGICYGTPK